jgi:peptidyl-prolyl cis-trans isomerase SurA
MQFKTYLNKKLIFITFFLILNLENLYALENKIVLKIDNELITTIDIYNEINYLSALNPKIQKLDKNKIYLIGKNSLIREKIKKNEILKFVKKIEIKKKYLDKLIQSRYSTLNLNTKDEFLEYIKNYEIDIYMIEEKISIESLWNQLIYQKFSNKVKLNKEKLKKQLSENNNQKSKSYLLSEIIFDISNNDKLEEKTNMIKNSIKKIGFRNTALTLSISDSSTFGGQLGWINEDSLNKRIKNNLIKLNPGDITDPIFSSNGFLILKIEEIKFIKKNYNLDDELEKLTNFKINEQLNQYSNIYFNKIKKNLEINEY